MSKLIPEESLDCFACIEILKESNNGCLCRCVAFVSAFSLAADSLLEDKHYFFGVPRMERMAIPLGLFAAAVALATLSLDTTAVVESIRLEIVLV